MATVFRVTIIATHLGQTMNNVINVRNTAAVATASDVATEMKDNYLTLIAQAQSGGLVYNAIRVQPMEVGNPAAFLLPVIIQGSKSSQGTELPFVCGVFQIQTATGGKHGRGRIYMPGVHVWGTNVGQWSSGAIAGINLGITNIIQQRFNSVNGSSFLDWGVMAKAIGSTFFPMTEIKFRTTPGLQRRRNIGVGI